MFYKLSFVLFVLVCITLVQTEGRPEEDAKNKLFGKVKSQKKRCVGPGLPKKKMQFAVETCRYLISSEKPTVSDIECFLKCFLQECKLTDHRGAPDKQAILTFLRNDKTKSTDDKWDSYIKAVTSNCFGKPVKEIDPLDEKCQGYAKFTLCMLANKVVKCPLKYLQ